MSEMIYFDYASSVCGFHVICVYIKRVYTYTSLVTVERIQSRFLLKNTIRHVRTHNITRDNKSVQVEQMYRRRARYLTSDLGSVIVAYYGNSAINTYYALYSVFYILLCMYYTYYV